MSRPKVLVTGASGFLGSHICEAAHEEGHEVHALIRETSSRQWLNQDEIHIHVADLGEREVMTLLLKDMDYVIHNAGVLATVARDAAECKRVNVDITRVLAEESIRAGIKRLVYVSSLAAGGPGKGPKARTEEDPDNPVSNYGRSKKAAEGMLYELRDRLSVVSLRYGMIYGPRGHNTLGFFKTLQGNLVPLMGLKPLYSSVIYVRDAACAAVSALSANVSSGSVYQITDGNSYTIEELCDSIEEALGKKKRAKRIKVPFWLVMLKAWWNHDVRELQGISPDQVRNFKARYWYASPEKAVRELGWKPEMDLSKGLAETVECYQEYGWLQ